MTVKKISDVENRYFKILLVASTSGSGKTILKKFAQELQCSIINLNYEISKKMINVPREEWGNHIDSVINELLPDSDQPAVIDHIEILFSPEFQADPLQILKRLSRMRVVIASWPGSFSNGQLIHGSMNDEEYFVASGTEVADIEIYSLPIEE
jgi:hypothetical protein